MTPWVGWWILGCVLGDDGGRRAPTSVTCPEDSTLRETPPGTPLEERLQPETHVFQCVDAEGRTIGDHLERYPGDPGSVAVEGRWAAGRVDGAWTVWRPDGAFAKRIHYVDGVADGEWLEVTSDGRVTAVHFAHGKVVDLSSLPADTEMPEWNEGVETRGRRYQGRR